MTWSFETDPEFQRELDWMDTFVREEVQPIDHLIASSYDTRDPLRNRLIKPLQEVVKARKLWACHLGPDLGGQGYGQVKLALMNEILGRSGAAPVVFGCQAPDSGNAEILAHFGTTEQKERYLKPLLNNDIVSCYSMTEPQGGSDPKVFTTTAIRDGDHWVINGEKWFSSHAKYAEFLIVMVVTDPDEPRPYHRHSMFIVPRETPGVEIVRGVGYGNHDKSHAYMRYTNVRVPADHLLGKQGGGFAAAQTRLGGGRIHHAMRSIATARTAFDYLCQRAASRFTQGERLADKQMVQEKIADSWAELEQFRLLVLQTAWKIDKYNDYLKVRRDIASVKAQLPKMLREITSRALFVHGALGLSTEMPFAQWVLDSFHMGLADGVSEIHKITAARQIMRDYKPSETLFPAYHLPAVKERARQKYAHVLAEFEAEPMAAQ